jgi:flavodoxin
MPDLVAFDRSAFLRTAIVAVTAATFGITPPSRAGSSAASIGEPAERRGPRASRHPRVLLAYFSRPGENYYYGGRTDLKVGNTEVVARMIRKLIRCDVHRIRATDPYPHDYEKTVARNVREQETDARPRIANPLRSVERYDVVLLASPIWNVRAPMIMSTFAESHDFTGKTIFPVTTYAMSGLGTTPEDYAALCPRATIGCGLAVQGEKARGAEPEVEAWLRRIRLLAG